MCHQENFSKTWWQKRTKLEKVFIILLSASCFILVAEILGFVYVNENPSNVCHSTECVKAAAQILRFIDTSVDPCQNFHYFACGTFMKNSLAGDVLSPQEQLYTKSNKQMYAILVEDEKVDDITSVKAIKKIYEACMDDEIINEDKGETLLDLLENLGGWPLLEKNEWEEDEYDWITCIYSAKQIGLDFNFFLSITEIEYFGKSIPYVEPPHVSHHSEPTSQDNYIKYIVDIAVLLNASMNIAQKEVNDLVIFEHQLQKIIESTKIYSSGIYSNEKIISIGEVQMKAPQIQWLEFLNNLSYPGYSFRKEDMIFFDADYYIPPLFTLINNTSKRTQANYFIWKIIEANIDYLGKDIWNKKKYYMLSVGKTVDEIYKDRHKYCTKCVTETIVPIAAQVEYVRRYLTESKINIVNEIFSNIKTEYETSLKNAEWITETTKFHLIEKLLTLKLYIGNADYYFMDGIKFDERIGYHEIDLDADDFIELIANVKKVLFNLLYSNFYKNGTISELFIVWDNVNTINVYYVAKKNIMILSAATLQNLLFNEFLPMYYVYGGIGSVIASELTNIFDSDLDNYEEEEEKDLHKWDNVTQQAYADRINCIIKQQDNYKRTKDKFEMNKLSTIIKNFNNLVGIKIAYKAYNKFLKTHGDENMFPGINFEQNQLFWIMTSLHKCQPNELNGIFKTDENLSAAASEIIGPLKNIDLFANDYGCPLGRPMNPVQKCTIL